MAWSDTAVVLFWCQTAWTLLHCVHGLVYLLYVRSSRTDRSSALAAHPLAAGQFVLTVFVCTHGAAHATQAWRWMSHHPAATCVWATQVVLCVAAYLLVVAHAHSRLPFAVYRSLRCRAVDCSVCLSRISCCSEVVRWPGCRHLFHASCVQSWAEDGRDCPLCRGPGFALPGTFVLGCGSSSSGANPLPASPRPILY